MGQVYEIMIVVNCTRRIDLFPEQLTGRSGSSSLVRSVCYDQGPFSMWGAVVGALRQDSATPTQQSAVSSQQSQYRKFRGRIETIRDDDLS